VRRGSLRLVRRDDSHACKEELITHIHFEGLTLGHLWRGQLRGAQQQGLQLLLRQRVLALQVAHDATQAREVVAGVSISA